MGAELQDSAILIRRTRFTDTSLIVHWLTPDHGLVKAVVKGALSPKSPHFGRLDLFLSGTVCVRSGRGGELHFLQEFAVTNWAQPLARDYAVTLAAGYFCRAAEQAAERNHPDPPLFDLLKRALGHLEEHPASERAITHFDRQLTMILGIGTGTRDAATALDDWFGFPSRQRNDALAWTRENGLRSSDPPPIQ